MHNKIPISCLLLIAASIACTQKTDSAHPATDTTISAGQSDSAPPPPPVATAPSGCADTRIRDDGIGGLRIGASLASLKANCRVLRDTTVTDSEGMPARRLMVEIGSETVDAEIVDDKVWRVSVKSLRYRTADSLGVGTPLSGLLELREPRGMMGEGALYFASPAHCGLSFRLSENRPLDPSGDWKTPALARLPASTRVTEVLIVRCVKPF